MSNIEDQFGLGDIDDASSDFGPSTPHIGRGTVRVGKVEYAVDLSWHLAAEAGKVAKEARAYAKLQSDRPDFYCVRKAPKAQFGLGYSILNHKTNLPSLGAHIAQSRGPSFVALFAIPSGGFYLLGVQQGAILSDAERFFESQGEAIAAFDQLLGLHDWPEVIAPASFDVEGAVDLPIEQALVGKASVRLQDLKASTAYLRYVLGGILAVAVVVGGKLYYAQIEQAAIDADLQNKLNAAQTSVGLKQEQPKIPDMPWVNKLVGFKALEACHAEIMKFPLDIPGWDITDLDCKPVDGGVNVVAYMNRKNTLENGGTPVEYAMKMVKFNGLNPTLSPKPGGTSSQIAFQWSSMGVPKNPIDIKTLTVGEISNSVLLIMESRRTSVVFSPADTTQWWSGLNIEFKTSLSPLGFTDVLGALPGYLLDEVDYAVDRNEFTIKGKVYEEKPKPVGAVNANVQQ